MLWLDYRASRTPRQCRRRRPPLEQATISWLRNWSQSPALSLDQVCRRHSAKPQQCCTHLRDATVGDACVPEVSRRALLVCLLEPLELRLKRKRSTGGVRRRRLRLDTPSVGGARSAILQPRRRLPATLPKAWASGRSYAHCVSRRGGGAEGLGSRSRYAADKCAGSALGIFLA